MEKNVYAIAESFCCMVEIKHNIVNKKVHLKNLKK